MYIALFTSCPRICDPSGCFQLFNVNLMSSSLQSIQKWKVTYSLACHTPRDFDLGRRRCQALVRFTSPAPRSRHFSDSLLISSSLSNYSEDACRCRRLAAYQLAADPKLETWFQCRPVTSAASSPRSLVALGAELPDSEELSARNTRGTVTRRNACRG